MAPKSVNQHIKRSLQPKRWVWNGINQAKTDQDHWSDKFLSKFIQFDQYNNQLSQSTRSILEAEDQLLTYVITVQLCVWTLISNIKSKVNDLQI